MLPRENSAGSLLWYTSFSFHFLPCLSVVFIDEIKVDYREKQVSVKWQFLTEIVDIGKYSFVAVMGWVNGLVFLCDTAMIIFTMYCI